MSARVTTGSTGSKRLRSTNKPSQQQEKRKKKRKEKKKEKKKRLTGIFGAFVMHEVVAAAEASEAVLALEGFLAFVDEHVRLQLVRVGEARRAQVAGVRALARVDA